MNILKTLNAIGVTCFMEEEEIEKLVELAINKEVLEIGSFMGGSACAMCIVAKSVFCVDTFRATDNGQTQMENCTTYGAFLDAVARFENVEEMIATSAGAAKLMNPDRAFDMIFLDAMHTKEEVRADILRWVPRLRDDGILAVHDYGHQNYPGVKQAVDELFGPQQDTVRTLMWMRRPWPTWVHEQASVSDNAS